MRCYSRRSTRSRILHYMTKCATAARCSLPARVVRVYHNYDCCLLCAASRVHRVPATWHIESFIDTLPLTNQRGLRSVGSLRLAIQQVATGGIQSRPVAASGNKWYPVTSSGNKWQQVASSHVQWQQVSPGGSAIAFRFAPRRPN